MSSSTPATQVRRSTQTAGQTPPLTKLLGVGGKPGSGSDPEGVSASPQAALPAIYHGRLKRKVFKASISR